TRNQIKTLMDPTRAELTAGAIKKEAKTAADDGEHTDSRAILPPEVPQFFVPLRSSKPAAATLVYKPQVLGCAQVYYNDAKSGVDLTVDYSYLVDVTDEAVAVNWPDAEQEEL